MTRLKPLKIDDYLIVSWVVCEDCLDCFKIGDIVYTDGFKYWHEICHLTKVN